MASITWKRTAVAAATLTALAINAGPAQGAAVAPAGASKPTILDLTGLSGVTDTLWGDDTTKQGKTASQGPGSWDASVDLGSMYNLTRTIGAQAAWDQGVTGNGVTVAVVDTGITPVPGLDKDDKIVNGPDLSFESQASGTRYLDGYGHGTHIAGIIAGKDDGYDPHNPDSSKFAGVAPDAKLLNMKVGTGDGGADVSQVIAALDWTVAHKNDNGMHVRVINLSYGTESLQPWQVDPLAKAVENAWNNGILVVTAAGNDGLDVHSLLMPAIDPHVLAVGASDHRGTASTLDDTVASFTNGGDLLRHADVLAPGKSVVSLRVPGSYIDDLHPEGLVPQDPQQRFFRGSGTSQAAAVVSGEAALLFQANPKLTPDQVKALLTTTAQPMSATTYSSGAGMARVDRAVTWVKTKLVLPALPALAPASTGTGSLEASRGGEHVVDPQTGQALTGEVDALGSPWNRDAWSSAESAGKSWVGGSWNGRVWTGTKWDHNALQAVPWTGVAWDGVPWASHDWSNDSFQARSWRGDDWKARSWREESWTARSWRELG
ncbi:MAG: S8 family serine peptidase [Marmoricola sp.]|nr:S8 family serine peptidase [Marmoricola sp.]